MRPLIGVTAFAERKPHARYLALSERYTRSLAEAGGLPIVLPTELGPPEAEAYVDRIDGLLLSGGGDLSPLLFGEDPSPKVESISTARDEAELALFRAARERGLPILAICRGLQVVNVALGGDLYQDIPSQLPGASGHNPAPLHAEEPYHHVRVEAGSLLDRALTAGGSPVAVNSFHHQAARRVAPGLRVTARSADGVVEALEGEGPPFLLAVQFHPEGMTARYPRFLGLFRLFVEAASASGAR